MHNSVPAVPQTNLSVAFQPERASGRGLKNTCTLTQIVTWCLYVFIAIAIGTCITSLIEYKRIASIETNGISASLRLLFTTEFTHSPLAMIMGFQLVIFTITGLCTLMWIHRANYNAGQMTATQMMYTPNWSVGWFFIPIACLWKPYLAIKEIWRTSHSPNTHPKQGPFSNLPLWWALWLVSKGLALLLILIALKSVEVSALKNIMVLTVILNAVNIPLALIFLSIVKSIHTQQLDQCQILSQPDSPLDFRGFSTLNRPDSSSALPKLDF